MDSKKSQGEVEVPVLKVRKFQRLETKIRGGLWALDGADDDLEQVDGFINHTKSTRNGYVVCPGYGR